MLVFPKGCYRTLMNSLIQRTPTTSGSSSHVLRSSGAHFVPSAGVTELKGGHSAKKATVCQASMVFWTLTYYLKYLTLP